MTISLQTEAGPGPRAELEIGRAPARRHWFLRYIRSANGIFGTAVLVILVFTACFPGLISPYNPLAQQFSILLGPSGAHWFGTDELGRDILARLIYGTRDTLLIALGGAGLAAGLGVPIGLSVGYFRGLVESVLMRIIDVLMALPGIVIALVTVAILGPSIRNVMIAIGIGWMPVFVRVVRASTLGTCTQAYVTAARGHGARSLDIMFRTIVPNIMPVIIVQLVVALSDSLVAGASLSFLGLGPPPPAASWGSMLQTGQQYLYADPFYCLAPGIALVIAIASFDAVGRGLQQALGVSGGRV